MYIIIRSNLCILTKNACVIVLFFKIKIMIYILISEWNSTLGRFYGKSYKTSYLSPVSLNYSYEIFCVNFMNEIL